MQSFSFTLRQKNIADNHVGQFQFRAVTSVTVVPKGNINPAVDDISIIFNQMCLRSSSY